MPALGDTPLLEAAADACGPSVAEVVRAHASFVGRTLRYLGVRESDLEDAAQEVFVVVHRRLGGFEGRSSMTTWLYGVCVRVASARRRSVERRREAVMATPPESAVAAEQERQVERGEARRKLLAVLDTLDEEQRAVFVLYEVERQSMRAIAEALGCPLQTAYYRLHAARKAVVRAVGGSVNEEDGA